MILNFEDITEDLTEIELKYLDDVKQFIKDKLTGTLSPVKQNILTNYINNRLKEKHGIFLDMNFTSVRLRKFINHFRSNGILPLIATSQGCYLSSNPIEIEKQIKSLEQRARSIQKAADGLKKFL